MENVKVVTSNRKAHFEYFLSEKTEVGIELKGTEIKSLKFHGCSLNDSYVVIKNNEAYILGMNIAPFVNGNIFNHDPMRTRKLLMHKNEILKFKQKVVEKGYTIVCTQVYLKNGKAKLEIALAKGKNLVDKRETIKNRDREREAANAKKY